MDATLVTSLVGAASFVWGCYQWRAGRRDTLAQQARGDVSGVNLDREAADLLRLQQAYQGCARIIQVAREITQSIFAVFG